MFWWRCKLLTLGVLSFCFIFVNCIERNEYSTIEKIQQHNIEVLSSTLPLGFKLFCSTPVDEGIMLLYADGNPSGATINLMTVTNQSVELPIKSLSEIHEYDINPKRKTLVYVNGFYTTNSYFSVMDHLNLLQKKRRDLNIIVVNFAKNIQQLYAATRHLVGVHGNFIALLLNQLIENGLQAEDITLVGHSVGANIAAFGSKLLNQFNKLQIGQLIAIDPAIMCRTSDIHVNANASKRVVVIHGEGDIFGLRPTLGTIDIYLNGIGYFPRRKLQPGCETKLCSHMYPFVLFMEALVEGVMIQAVKCNSWQNFRNHTCEVNNTIALGINYPEQAKGVYFCLTQPSPPFTYMEHGLQYRKKSTKKSKIL